MLRDKFRDGFLFSFHITVVAFYWDPPLFGFSLSPSRYHLIYGGKGELVSFKAGSTVWEGSCGVNQENPSYNPTLEELTASQAQLLKQIVSKATKECASQLVAHFLGSGKTSKSIAAP